MHQPGIAICFKTHSLCDSDFRYMSQMGAAGVVCNIPKEWVDLPLWPLEGLVALRKRVESFGLKLLVMEGPQCQIAHRIKMGQPGRDEDIANFCESIHNMGKAGIPVRCYNWMTGMNWVRTSLVTPTRGGALTSSYDHEEMKKMPTVDNGGVDEAGLWKNLEYFLKAAVPAAEKAGVLLAMHPDDPPLSPVRGMPRILTNPDNMQRVLDLVPSPNNGLTFCQGSFAQMGADVLREIRRFGGQKKIFFVHFRDIRGTPHHFTETFHDDGQTDMCAAMKAYYEIGFTGPMRPDHAPTMEGDPNDDPGYARQGQLFAVGYMKGLMEAIEKSS